MMKIENSGKEDIDETGGDDAASDVSLIGVARHSSKLQSRKAPHAF